MKNCQATVFTAVVKLQKQLTIKLVLNDVVKNFKQKENQVMVNRWAEQEPRAWENVQQV